MAEGSEPADEGGAPWWWKWVKLLVPVVIPSLVGLAIYVIQRGEISRLEEDLAEEKATSARLTEAREASERRLVEISSANRNLSASLASLTSATVDRLAGQLGRIDYQARGTVRLDQHGLHVDSSQVVIDKPGWVVQLHPTRATFEGVYFSLGWIIAGRQMLGRGNEMNLPAKRWQRVSLACLEDEHELLLIWTDVQWVKIEYAVVGVQPNTPCSTRSVFNL